ncbi:MAG: hypothetical protein KDB07_00275 [Planctomycetes bacterium]|nr:hypothetical protein [Planctomycetota bacterium]
MWDRSSSQATKLRPIVGAVALLSLVALPFFGEATAPTTVLANAGEASSMLIGAARSQEIAIVTSESDFSPFEGTLIQIEKEDGTGQIIGSLKVVDGKLYAQLEEKYHQGYVLEWHPAIERLDQGIALIIGENAMKQEIKRLEEALVPVVNDKILPPLSAVLSKEFEALLEETIEKEQSEIETIAEKIAEKLAPEIEELSNKLVETAWDKIGVWGVAEGLWRKGSSAIGSAAKDAWKWGKGLFGDNEESEEKEETPFLSDERKKELRIALEKDIAAFWKDNNEKIMEKGREVIGSREDLLKRLEDRVTQRFSEAAVSTFRQHAHHLEAPLVNFANDIGLRHLVTDAGAPRMTLAYAVRSGTGLTDRPLVVLRKAEASEYQFTLTRMGGLKGSGE